MDRRAFLVASGLLAMGPRLAAQAPGRRGTYRVGVTDWNLRLEGDPASALATARAQLADRNAVGLALGDRERAHDHLLEQGVGRAFGSQRPRALPAGQTCHKLRLGCSDWQLGKDPAFGEQGV